MTKAFDISVFVLSEIMRVLNVGADKNGNVYDGPETWMRGTLVEAMLKTPARDMRYMETVDDAGRWGISVYPIRQLKLDYQSGYRACVNRSFWDKGASSQGVWELDPKERQNVGIGIEYILDGRRTLSYTMNHWTGDSCDVHNYDGSDVVHVLPFVPGGNDPSGVDITRITFADAGWAQDVDMGLQALVLYPPETQLAALVMSEEPEIRRQERQSASVDPVEWAPRFCGDKVTLWDHNGSKMAWESKGNQRWIWYYEPRQGLLDAGIPPGTLLFDGRMKNGALSGTARRFSSKCGDMLYEVSGRPQGTLVVLEGEYQRRDSDCANTGRRMDSLAFQYTAAAPE